MQKIDNAIIHPYEWPEGEEIIYVRPPVEEYHGKLHNFYSTESFPELKPLLDNWEKIRDEVLAVEARDGLLTKQNSLSPAKVEGEGSWSLTYLVSFNWLFHENIKRFPVTWSIVQQIPNCVFAGISILPPKTEIKPHYGDTNGIVRAHLALVVPEPYPTIGIHVNGEERGWKVGEIMAFINVQKHHVWNHSDKRRYVLMFDFVPKPLLPRLNEICTNALGNQSFVFFYRRSAIVRKMPDWMHRLMIKIFAFIWKCYLPVQRRFSWATIKSGDVQDVRYR
ncbi:MAG: aspartyl/asparaginyl beta-hydroxylase domain-containing protein [Chitinophagales bacterium]|nr:aspartyl/asparaginyl beta-hydroxylase domain-containing protein [Chitinophagales bacterium]MDW8417789.1 aspartyl/asparaginyl beta-hydroxylase domain-containing protein [Chitinophagales bacterium]